MNERDPLHRWRDIPEREGLTWGKMLDGDAFARKIIQYAPPMADLLEFGFGYCRILLSLRAMAYRYRTYCGVDISQTNVDAAAERFGEKETFRLEDFNLLNLVRDFDCVFSSLTFKHQYPDCRAGLASAYGHLRPGGVALIDFMVGTLTCWEPMNWIKQYTREELWQLCGSVGFSAVRFDTVEHAPDKVRMLLVANK